MEKWLHTIPNYMRVILDTPPGREQKEALAEFLDRIRSQLQRVKFPDASTKNYIVLLREQAERLRAAQDPDVFSTDEMAAITRLMNAPSFASVYRTGRFRSTNVPLKDLATL
jgi:hypothetical protein